MARPYKSVHKIQSLIWDFSQDGGQAGISQNSNVSLPGRAILYIMFFEVLKNVSCPGNSKIQIGCDSTPANYFESASKNLFTNADNQFIPTFPTIIIANSLPILFTIAGNDAVSGVIRYHFIYIESPIML